MGLETIQDEGPQAPAHPDFEDLWTNADQGRACSEGWAIFEAHGYLEIERNDVNDPPYEDAPYHESDDAAIEHVRARAAQGSELHGRALVIHARYEELILQAAHAQ